MKSIVLIVPYIGKWPLWFEAHLVSIAQNPTIDWLFITDCKIPEKYPENVRFVPATLQSLNTKINEILELQMPLSPRKLCDVRPAYGKIFQDYIATYDFWGFCDVDIIWGAIRDFVSDDILSNYDIISSRKEAISGHFTLFSNNAQLNEFYRTIPKYETILQEKNYMWGEEQLLTNHVKAMQQSSDFPRVYWETYWVNNVNGKAHQEYYLDKWLWKGGTMLKLKNGKPINEPMYLHFINWKRTMRTCEVEYSHTPSQFYISFTGMHYSTHSDFAKALNKFKNLFNGYHIRESRRIKKKKIKSIWKRMQRKLKRI